MRSRLPDIVGVVVVCAVMLVAYFQVPVRPAGRSAPRRTCRASAGSVRLPPTGACSTNTRNDPQTRRRGVRVAARTVGAGHAPRRSLSGELPLWNPYEGLGTPLAADPPNRGARSADAGGVSSTRPSSYADLVDRSLWLLLIGVGAYVAAPCCDCTRWPATVVGVVYGLSGWFFAYSNNWFFRVVPRSFRS